MGEKQCGKCGEIVDEVKAFCPGCGNAFVDEKERTTKTDFDLSANTIRLGDSMYNKMLSDMGLSISKQPNREPGVESVPAVSGGTATAPAEEKVIQPAPKKSSTLKRVLIGIAVLVVVLALLALAGVAIFFYSK
jgi:hypothetical protein